MSEKDPLETLHNVSDQCKTKVIHKLGLNSDTNALKLVLDQYISKEIIEKDVDIHAFFL